MNSDVEWVSPVDWESTSDVSVAELQKIIDISMMLNSTLHLRDLLELALDASQTLTYSEAASILLMDKKTGELHFTAATGIEIPPGVIVPLEGSIAGWVVRHEEPAVMSGAEDSRHYTGVDMVIDNQTRSLLAVPLIIKGQVIGVLETINKFDDKAYTRHDLAILQVLAGQAAVAIENARLFEQSDLIGEIMHELKTPLMALTSASDLLAMPQLPQEKRSEIVSLLQQESKRLVKMTQDFLDLSRLESGRMHIAKEEVDLKQLIPTVAALQESQAKDRGITIVPEVAEDVPMVVGDNGRLRQVMLNLVSNAIKYNVPDGTITVRATYDDAFVRVAVIDTGKGISPESIPHLFERFYRVPDSEGYSEGSGLGLSITNKIVEEHGGRIEVESEVNVGTTMTIVLPLPEKEG
ncbi:MAG TPA: HAMP domain-containing sensor histidine kinase [Anaerolineae bacterium]|nr:HAMP domain-containing sensor histidine kinase [Anaerolineae bacterium]